MTRQVPQILYFLGLLLLLAGCAQVAPLTGGKKDLTPPLPLEYIPANETVNFKGGKILIRFNEYIQVKDLSNQLIISPYLQTRPEIKAEGKSLVITFEAAELLPNTTYRFYFGNAVADMNESNPIRGFEYIFATGAHIDTLVLGGTVVEAADRRPAAGSLVTLYTANRTGDSLVYITHPDYFARCDEQGAFVFRNLPAGTFRVYSLADKNKNFLFDAGAEKVGFLNEPLRLESDSNISLVLFEEEVPKGFVKSISSPQYGRSHIFLNRKAAVRLQPLSAADSVHIFEPSKGMVKDTVTVFYRHLRDTLRLVLHNLTFNKTDTLVISLPESAGAAKRRRPIETNIVSGKLGLDQQVLLKFNTWMDTAGLNPRTMSLRSSDTAAPLPALSGYWRDVTTFALHDVFKENATYSLKIDTGAFHDVYGKSNDSLKFSFAKENRLEFGKLSLKIAFLKKQAYVIQLVNEQQNVVKQTPVLLSLSASNAVSTVFSDIQPGTYLVKIIYDDNENGKWDTGHLLRKKQPEKVFIHSKQIKILSDWEIEEEIRLSE